MFVLLGMFVLRGYTKCQYLHQITLINELGTKCIDVNYWGLMSI